MKKVIIDCLEKCSAVASYFGGSSYKRFPAWQDAARNSTGYNSPGILEKVYQAALMVKAGRAVYERDSVLFNEIQYSWPLLAGLMWVVAQSVGELNLVDFGGALGSSYFQNRQFLKNLRRVRWNIVEQKHYVDVGKKDFESDELRFYYDLQSCLLENKPNIVLLSGVLQYLENPYKLLEQIKRLPFKFIIIGRTSFCDKGEDIIGVQKVPREIFNASYPCWVFSITKFRDFWGPKEIVTEFYDLDERLASYSEFKGFIIRRSDENAV